MTLPFAKTQSFLKVLTSHTAFGNLQKYVYIFTKAYYSRGQVPASPAYLGAVEREVREGREEAAAATLTRNLRLAMLSLHLVGGGSCHTL